MSTWVLVATAIIIMDVLVVGVLVRGLIVSGWGPLAKRHPARPPEADAVFERFQSFKLGLFNLGWSVHVAADAGHLHLTPVKVLRWLGMRPASLPWSSLAVLRRSRHGKWTTVRIDGGPTLAGPAWCLELADDASG